MQTQWQADQVEGNKKPKTIDLVASEEPELGAHNDGDYRSSQTIISDKVEVD